MSCFKILEFTLMMLVYQAEARTGQNDHSKDALISVIPNSVEDIDFLLKLDKMKIIYLWDEIQLDIGDKKLMRIHRCRLKDVMNNLKKRDMKTVVVSYNLQRLIKQSIPHRIYPLKFDAKKFHYDQFHQLKYIDVFLKHLTKEHEDISELEVFGKSYEKRPMYAVKISSNTGNIMSGRDENETPIFKEHKSIQRSDKKIILIDCGIHSREWISISFCLYFLNALITGYKENRKDFKTVLTKYDFIIIPVMNPDGYAYTHQGDRLWRKTRSKNPSSPCLGIDANRNFYTSPEECEDKKPCSQSYCGSKAFSEPETIALRNLLKRNSGKLKGYFNMHCYGQYWLMPWAKYNRKPIHYDEMMRVAEIGVKALEKRYHTKYTFGQVPKLMYKSLGTSIDYVYEKGYVNYSYAIELRDKGECGFNEQCGFLLPEDKILPTCEEATDGVVAAILAMK